MINIEARAARWLMERITIKTCQDFQRVATAVPSIYIV